MKKTILALLLSAPALALCAEPVYRLDLAKPEPRTDEPLLNEGGKAADGTVYSATKNGFYVNGRPWYPVSGEFHFARYRPEFWDEELAKMRAGGVDVVATYVLWNHHEGPEGKWDWSGRRDFRKFLELAQKRGLKVWMRFGPYCNAEAKHGGRPDFAMKGSRTNDPGYLAKVDAYFKELAIQTKGMFVKDGGPIVGIQLENEFASGDPKHITKLREMAVACGLIAPYYTVTANTRFDKDTAIPLQGGYVYRGWEARGGQGAVTGFIFGSDEWTANTDLGGAYYKTLDYPRGYCELGTGSPMRGNTRFLVAPKYVIGTTYDAIGRGSNYLGYYMFHGGTQIPGLNEGWPLTYDFQAPLGEYGRIRESYRHYRRIHTFVHTYAAELLATRIVTDSERILDPKQTSRLRYIGRFDKEGRGFVFFGNVQRNLTLPERKGVQIELDSPAGKTLFPAKPLDIPTDAYAFFPVRTDLGGATLEQALVEPIAKIVNRGEPDTFVYWKPSWTDGAMTFSAGCDIVDVSGKTLVNASATERTIRPDADKRGAFQVRRNGQPVANIIVLTEAESLNATVAEFGGKSRLLLTGKDTQVAAVIPAVELLGQAGSAASVEVFPSAGLSPVSGWQKADATPPFAGYRMALGPAVAAPKLVPEKPGVWKIAFDSQDWKKLAEARLDLSYAGSEAKLLVDGKEYSNDLYHDESWGLDLLFFRENLDRVTITISDWNNGINGVTKPEGPMPAITKTDWKPLVRVPFAR